MDQQTPHRDNPTPDSRKENFPLAPCIFMPFKGFPPGPPQTLDQMEKLQKIIENMSKQQDIVRSNLASIYDRRADYLRAKAKEALETMPPYEEDPIEQQRREKEFEAIILGMKSKAVQGKNYEFKIPDSATKNATPRSDGDVEMGGVDTKPRIAKTIHQRLSQDLRKLVDSSVHQLELYDAHSKAVLSPYQQALDRRVARGDTRPAPIRTASGQVRDILSNRGEASPVDHNAIQRMSTGMPIARISPQKPVRNYEDIESLTRR